jgi:ParB family transcriptional regulator, chromosome partitioning protein
MALKKSEKTKQFNDQLLGLDLETDDPFNDDSHFDIHAAQEKVATAVLTLTKNADLTSDNEIIKDPHFDVNLFETSPFQARIKHSKSHIKSLSQSILTVMDDGEIKGVLQPILGRPHPTKNGHFQIAAGEGRWLATIESGIKMIPAIIRDYTDKDMMLVGLDENLKRKNLLPLEIAYAAKRLKDDFGLSNILISEAMNPDKEKHSKTWYPNVTKMLELPSIALKSLENQCNKKFTAKHARLLFQYSILPSLMVQWVDDTVANDWSARDLESKLKLKIKKLNPPRPNATKTPDDIDYERRWNEHLGVPTTVVKNTKGKYVITIECATLDILTGVEEQAKLPKII